MAANDCNGKCILDKKLYSKTCPEHGQEPTANDDSFLKKIKDVADKRTSNGFKPSRGERVQLRGD